MKLNILRQAAFFKAFIIRRNCYLSKFRVLNSYISTIFHFTIICVNFIKFGLRFVLLLSGYTPLTDASTEGHVDIVKLLIEHNAAVNDK